MRFFVILFILNALTANTFAQKCISMNQQSKLDISDKMGIFRTTNKNVRFDQIPEDHFFKPNKHKLLNISTNDELVWTRFTMRNGNQYPLTIILEYRNAGIGNIDFYIKKDRLLIYQKDDSNRLLKARGIRGRYAVKQITLDPNTPYTVYTKISGSGNKLKIPVTVYDQFGYNQKSSYDNLESGLFYGIFITLLLTGLLFLILRFKVHEQLFYIAYLATFTTLFLMHDGYANQYLFWEYNSFISTVTKSFGFVLIGIFSGFLKSYFKPYCSNKNAINALTIQFFTNIFLFGFAVSFSLNATAVEILTAISALTLLTTVTIIQLRGLESNNLHRYIYISVILFGIIFGIFTIQPFLRTLYYNDFHAILKTFVIFQLILIALSFYRRIQIAHSKTQHENIANLEKLNTIIEKQKTLLEKKVKERTNSLVQKNNELEEQIKQNKLITKELNIKHIELEAANKELEKSFKSSSADHIKLHKALMVNKEQQVALQVSIDEISHKNYKLEQQNEEILSQRDKIREQHHLLEIKNRDITDSIQYAERIQNSIMPPPSLLKEYFKDSYIFFKPKDKLSGDFYWFDTIHANNTICHIISAIDCTGHGVPGALMSIIARDGLHEAIHGQKLTDPGKIIMYLNKLIIRTLKKEHAPDSLKDGMDLSLITLYPQEKTMHYAGARNPLYFFKNKELNILDGSIFSAGTIGTKEHPVIFKTQTIKYEHGDTIYLFSDGFADQFGGVAGKKFTYNRLKKMFNLLVRLPIQKQESKTTEILHKWQGDYEQTDDIIIIGIKL